MPSSMTRPLPKVGDTIVLRLQPDNPFNWPHPGTVCAVVDDKVFVVRRRDERGATTYELIDAVRWGVFTPDRHATGGLFLIDQGATDTTRP